MLGTPRVAILSAVETVTTKIPSTIEAAALCKMAERGQITGGMLDGPLAFDNAIDPEAARDQGDRPAVAGRAQILVVPDLEAGNMLAKNLTFLANADAAGIVLGARVPIVLTSRADIRADPAGLLRGGGALCAGAAAAGRDAGGVGRWGHPGDQRRFVEPQVPAVRTDGGELLRRVRGQIDGIGVRPRLRRPRRRAPCGRPRPSSRRPVPDLPAAIARRRPMLRGLPGVSRSPSATGWCTAARTSTAPVLIDAPILERLAALRSRWRRCTSRTTSRRSARLWNDPAVPQVACFDTAFHRGHAAVMRTVTPFRARCYEEGIRRYGFHGLSYEYVADRLRKSRRRWPTAA